MSGEDNDVLQPVESEKKVTAGIKFARILYLSTKTAKVVKIDDIKLLKGTHVLPFSPKNLNDFLHLKYEYAIKDHDKYETVSILRLGGMYKNSKHLVYINNIIIIL